MFSNVREPCLHPLSGGVSSSDDPAFRVFGFNHTIEESDSLLENQDKPVKKMAVETKRERSTGMHDLMTVANGQVFTRISEVYTLVL
jgi:hypothetical protein